MTDVVVPLHRPPHWTAEALCAHVDGELFFPDKGGSVREAKRVCAECPVRPECLQFALDRREAFGVWGGMSERERHAVIQRTRPDPKRAQCGTTGGYQKHRRKREVSCEPCLEAVREYQRKHYRNRRPA